MVIRLSVSESAKFFGVSQRTIARAIKNGEVTYIVIRGRYKLNLDSLLKWSQKKPTVKNKLAKQGVGQYVDKWKISNPHYSPNPDKLR
jgi:excisionase family DNA binding protein